MNFGTRPAALVLGASPRADLLPPEIKEGRKADVVRRRMVMAVIGVIVIGAAAYAYSSFQAVSAQVALASSESQTTTLLSQQTKYAPGRQIKQKITTVENARQLGVSTEIDWNSYMAKVEKSLPSNATITTFTADVGTPLSPADSATDPLLSAHVATLVFTANSDTLPDVEKWLQGLAKLPGFADANPDSVTRADSTYVATITMHITKDAYSGRFQPTPAPAASSTPAPTNTAQPTSESGN